MELGDARYSIEQLTHFVSHMASGHGPDRVIVFPRCARHSRCASSRINPLTRIGYSSGSAVCGHHRRRVVRRLGGRDHRLENGLRWAVHHRHRLLDCSREGFSRSGSEYPGAAACSPGPGQSVSRTLFLALAFSFFWFCAMLWIVYSWLPDLLYERFRLSLSSSGLNATLYIQLSCGVGVLIGGWLADRLALRIRSARLYVVGCGMFLGAPFAYLAFGAVTLARFRLYAVAF